MHLQYKCTYMYALTLTAYRKMISAAYRLSIYTGVLGVPSGLQRIHSLDRCEPYMSQMLQRVQGCQNVRYTILFHDLPCQTPGRIQLCFKFIRSWSCRKKSLLRCLLRFLKKNDFSSVSNFEWYKGPYRSCWGHFIFKLYILVKTRSR